ncbi:hypothetical protein MRX96_026397 [Rhipicephalus microplus]
MLSSAAAATTGFPRNDTVGVSHDDAQRAPGSPRCCDGAGACCHRRRHFGQTPKNLRQTNEWSEARARGRCSAVRDVARSRGNPAQPSPGRVRESRGGGSSPWHGEAGPGSSCEARPLARNHSFSTRFVGYEEHHFTSAPLFGEESAEAEDGLASINEAPLMAAPALPLAKPRRRRAALWEFKENLFDSQIPDTLTSRKFTNSVIVRVGVEKWKILTENWTFWQKVKYYPLIFLLGLFVIALAIQHLTTVFCFFLDKLCSVFGCPCRHETFLSWAEEQMARYPSGRWTREDGSVCEYEPSADEVEMSEELEYLLLTFPREPEGWLEELYNVVSS